MEKIHLDSDYMEGAHPFIMERLMQTNMEQTPGYGTDEFCERARKRILQACKCEEGEVHFMVGGTQANATVIGAILRPYEGVLAAATAHINVHEAGIVEAGGHKVLALPHYQGKITAAAVEEYAAAYYADESYEHMVAPGMVYISQPTEYGTLYSRDELEALSRVCRNRHLPLYIDGARLGYALAAPENDADLPCIARCCDAFYIGGTKVGALFGEAVVFTRKGVVEHFFTSVKQHGGLLAKGRLLGLQFETLFTGDLYVRIARNAIDTAARLRDALHRAGYKFFIETPTNQQFLLVTPDEMEKLSQLITFSVWEKQPDGQCVIRLATSWATRPDDIEMLARCLVAEE